MKVNSWETKNYANINQMKAEWKKFHNGVMRSSTDLLTIEKITTDKIFKKNPLKIVFKEYSK